VTAPAPEPPRPAREALAAFHRLVVALEAVAVRDDAEPEAQARAAFATLRRALVDLGAPETPPRRGGDGPLSVAYVLTCCADEALIHRLRWPGAAVWPGMLLERGLYGVEIAGERLVEAARDAVDRRDPPGRDATAALYLAFATGFMGGLRGAEGGAAEAARLTAGLYDAVMERAVPASLSLRDRFAQPAAHTLPAPRRARPRPVERAAAALGLVVVGWLALSHVFWTYAHADIAALADQVVALARNGR
jgi:type VI protein secretion system component VasF